MRYLIALSVILLFSCSVLKNQAQSEPGNTNPLKGTGWILSRIPDFELEKTRKEPSIYFNDSTSRVSGYTGCNGYGASYTLKGNTIKIGDVLSTKMACMPGMKTENKVINVLGNVDNFSISGDKLTLKQGEKVLAEFTRDKKEQK
ncbi:MAG: META domain-containing protein [Taibaiella sp.]|jgi:heat shock protein HslJ